MIIQSFGALQTVARSQPLYPEPTSVNLYGYSVAYATLYAKQTNVRTCVDFLARNIAQLGIHLYRRVSDTDRERITSSPILDWLDHPNPSTTRYRLIESLMGDLGIYFNAYWAKVRNGSTLIGLVRLPPEQMQVYGGLLPDRFLWTPPTGSAPKEFAPSEIVYFNGYNPLNPLMGLSPLETLRRVLAEEAAAGLHRETYWQNASRMEGVIERSKDAPNWTEVQQQAFREQWQEFAQGGARAGQIPVLPRGMTFKTLSYSAKDSEYLGARKLTREECAAAYHIPLPMVGILDHATFSNIKEQHKQLYSDCLGPWLEMIELELEAQILPEASTDPTLYLEFNIAAKLNGSFEDQAVALSVSVGRPFMTPNEGRARLNLPSIPGEGDRLAEQAGAPTPPPTGDAAAAGELAAADAVGAIDALADDPALAPVLRATRARQHARLRKVPPAARAAEFYAQMARWNAELSVDLTPLVGAARAERLARAANVETFMALDAAEESIQ